MCMVDDADGYVTVLSEAHRKARKAHKCSECHRQIEAGETYLVEGTLYDGEKKTHKTCQHCEVVREWLRDECGGFLYGGIEEDIREHAWEGYGIRVKMMAVGMERFWRRKDGRMWPLPRIPKASGHDRLDSGGSNG